MIFSNTLSFSHFNFALEKLMRHPVFADNFGNSNRHMEENSPLWPNYFYLFTYKIILYHHTLASTYPEIKTTSMSFSTVSISKVKERVFKV